MKGSISDETRIEHILDCIYEIENAIYGYNYNSFISNHVLELQL